MKKLDIPLVALICALIFGANTLAQDAAPAPANSAAVKAPQPTQAPAAGANTAEAGATRNIRFQFDGIPYSDVLERFAQMASKPLVADTNLQGTLSYNDPQPYSYQEALDTLNVILSMKGVMLMEDGHYLRVVPFKQLPQMPLRLLRGLDKTGDVRPGEIVTVVLEVKNLETKEVADAVVSMLSSAGSLAPLSRGRGLIVTDKLANIQRIRALLSAIDNESVAQRQMKAFTLVHASGAVVADLINRTFGAASAQKRTQFNAQTKQMDVLPPDPNDYVTAVYDDASRTLVLFGPRDRLTLAEELVSKFEDKEGGAGDVRIYYPQVTKADELAQMIHQAIPGVAGPKESAATAATKARVIADMAQNRLIVAAPIAGQLDQIELFINSLDKPVHGTGGATAVRAQTVQMTKVFRVRSSDASSVAKILSQALSRRLPTGATVPTANVTVEPNSQSVVVTGSPGEVQTAMDIVSQLESGSASPQSRRLQIITLQHQRIDAVLASLNKLVAERMSDKRFEGLPNPLLLPDNANNRLLVTAADEQFREIQQVVSTLDIAPDKARREMMVIPVQSKTAAEIIALTTQLMAQLGDEQTNPQLVPKLVADPSGKQIIVLATLKDLERITNLVQRLDGASYATSSRQFKGVELFSRTAAELTPLVQQLYAEQVKGMPEPAGGAATLLSDAKNNRVMVSGSEKEIARVEAIIRQLDPEGRTAAKEETRVIRLKTGVASDLAGLVEKSLSGQARPVKVLVDARSNSLVVTGDSKSVDVAAQIVEQLDTRSDTQPRELRIVDLKQGEAASVAPIVTSLSAEILKDQHGPNYTPQIKIVPDATGNRLILTGPKDELTAVATLIDQLNQSPESGGGARVFKLKSADATTVAQLVSDAMVRFDGRREPTKRVAVSADKESNSVIVSGSRSDLQDAQTIIERLDNEGTGRTTPRRWRLSPRKFLPRRTQAGMRPPLSASLPSLPAND
jgi:type II secretory pathway component GspD/PulD (secretin)